MILIFLPFSLYAGVAVLGNLSYKYVASKGETYTTVFKVFNTGENDQEVKIYLQDYSFNYDGVSFYSEPGSHNRSNAKWIQYNPKTLILKGKETQNIQFEVSVPIGDSLVGTYWSVLMVEGINPLDPTVKGQLIINESIRYAVQIITSIGKTGKGELEFQNPGVVSEGEKKFFNFILLNTGERYISPEVSIELFDDSSGLSVKSLKAKQQRIYPGTSTKWSFPLESIPQKKTYKAVIVADGSGEDVFGMEYTIIL